MAKKKSSTSGKSPTTSSSKKKVGYEELLEARREMEQAHAQAGLANTRLRAAHTDLSDFSIRDKKVAEAEAALQEARLRAAQATEKFHKLKAGK